MAFKTTWQGESAYTVPAILRQLGKNCQKDEWTKYCTLRPLHIASSFKHMSSSVSKSFRIKSLMEKTLQTTVMYSKI